MVVSLIDSEGHSSDYDWTADKHHLRKKWTPQKTEGNRLKEVEGALFYTMQREKRCTRLCKTAGE